MSENMANMPTPEATITDVDLKGFGFSGLTLLAKVFVSHPYSIPIPIGEIAFIVKSAERGIFNFWHKTDHVLRKGVILFLAITTFFEFLCIFLYAYIFGKLPIVKYYRKKAALEGSKIVTADLAATGIQSANRQTVVFDALRKFDVKEFWQLLPGEYTQMDGCAGRRGLDKIGTFVVLCRDDIPEEKDLRHVML
ncbi:equilibrative nucleotide transporter 4 [Phtheirospermum japonicum]|uniref:Equilibrative nucleotide transporter 4 n=1 Tax=Phtheirospermum japonicum TaxID=374723 RepID=A0A830CVF6_9LAMI|nr:equilibrative nucleotide transporter 4 [Phtheirospermum japonicum]